MPQTQPSKFSRVPIREFLATASNSPSSSSFSSIWLDVGGARCLGSMYFRYVLGTLRMSHKMGPKYKKSLKNVSRGPKKFGRSLEKPEKSGKGLERTPSCSSSERSQKMCCQRSHQCCFEESTSSECCSFQLFSLRCM